MNGTTTPSTSRRRSSIATPVMDSVLECASPRRERRATDEIHKQLTPALSHDVSNRRLSHASAQPVMEKEELDTLMKNCLEMASKNKFNNENVWALPLIDHLPDLVQSYDSSRGGFERMSAGLTTAVQIYTKRVESTLERALEAAYRIRARPSKRQEEGGVDMEVEDEEQGEPVMPSQTTRRRAKVNTETLAKMEDILDTDKDDPNIDLMFDRMLAKLDQGGCNGMMAQLGVCGMQWRSNPKRAQEGPLTLDTSEGMIDCSGLVDVGPARPTLSDPAESLRAVLGTSQHPSQSQQEDLKNFMEEAEDCLRRQEGYQSFYEEPAGALTVVDAPMHAPDMDAEMDGLGSEASGDGLAGDGVDGFEDLDLSGEPNIDVNFFDMDNDAEGDDGVEVASGGAEGHGGLEGPSFLMDPVEQDANGSDGDEEFDPLPQDVQELMKAFDVGVVGRSRWSHWKYHRSDAKPKRARRKRREKPEIDWTNLPAMEPNALDVAEDESVINLKYRKSVKQTLLDDFKIKENFLVEGFFKSRLQMFGTIKRKERGMDPGRDDMPEPVDDGWAFDDDAGGGLDMNFGFADEGDGDGTTAGAPEFDEDGFLKEPESIHEIAIERPVYAKQVNMKELKGNLLKVLELLSQRTSGSVICFSEVLSHLPRDAVSVHTAFIALLHVANEHRVRIENTADLREVHIKLPENFC